MTSRVFFVRFDAHIKTNYILAVTVQWGFLVSVQQVAVGVDVIFAALLLQWLDPDLILQETCPPTDWQYFLQAASTPSSSLADHRCCLQWWPS